MGKKTGASECGCGYRTDAKTHHDLLLSVEHGDFDAITSIVEVAVTWHELDYSQEQLIDPAHWVDFVERHQWSNRDRVLEFFLALDSLRTPAEPAGLAAVVPLRAG